MRIISKNQISGPCSLAVLFFATLCFIALIVLNIVMQKPFFEMGLNLQYKYQQSSPSQALQLIFNYFSILLGPIVIYILLFLYILFTKRKLIVLTHITFLFIATFITSILSQNLQHPSPFWYNSKIQKWAWKCTTAFANPNTHIVMFLLFLEPLFTDGFGCCGKRFCKPPLGFLLAILTLFIMNIKFYLGNQGLDQILFSLGIGLVLLVVYRYGYQRALLDLFMALLTGNRTCLRTLGILVATILSIGLPIAFFIINKGQRPINETYINNINKVCIKQTTGEELQGQALLRTSYVMISFGIIYGFIALRNNTGARQYLFGVWNYDGCCKWILHICMYILFVAGPFIAAYFLGKLIGGAFVKYIVSCVLYFITGFFISFLIPTLTQKCGIIKTLPEHIHIQLSQLHPDKI